MGNHRQEGKCHAPLSLGNRRTTQASWGLPKGCLRCDTSHAGDSFDDGDRVRKDSTRPTARKVTVLVVRGFAASPCYATPSTSDWLTSSWETASERLRCSVRACKQGLSQQSQGWWRHTIRDDRVVIRKMNDMRCRVFCGSKDYGACAFCTSWWLLIAYW